MRQHRFINNGRSPIIMGADYACVCGKLGDHSTVARHIAESSPVHSDAPPYAQLIIDDFEGGDTQANYLPNEPRKPAPTGQSLPLQRPDTPAPLPPPPSLPAVDNYPSAIAQPSTGLQAQPSIAELFQDMLRFAFEAGTASTATGETFESWYQREVLQ